MIDPAIVAEVEIKCGLELARLEQRGRKLSAAERTVFRLGYIAGIAYGLDVAKQVYGGLRK